MFIPKTEDIIQEFKQTDCFVSIVRNDEISCVFVRREMTKPENYYLQGLFIPDKYLEVQYLRETGSTNSCLCVYIGAGIFFMLLDKTSSEDLQNQIKSILEDIVFDLQNLACVEVVQHIFVQKIIENLLVLII